MSAGWLPAQQKGPASHGLNAANQCVSPTGRDGILACQPWWCDHVLVPDDTLSWPEVAARLAAARNYWLCTTTPRGLRTQPRYGEW